MFLFTTILYEEIGKIYYFCNVDEHYSQVQPPETKCYSFFFLVEGYVVEMSVPKNLFHNSVLVLCCP